MEYEKEKAQSEYFSALNWRDAGNLINEKVEFSNDPDIQGWRKGTLIDICTITPNFKGNVYYEYIRTIPYAHPTITIGGVELPKPETEAPAKGTKYWLWSPDRITSYTWDGSDIDMILLKAGRIHLTEDRAKAWADWWDETVIKQIKGE